jgi:proteic killer suppression protein
VIKSFRCEETRLVFAGEGSRHLPAGVQRIALRKLLMLDAAQSLSDLRSPPGNRLEKLKGRRQGEYSLRINDQWRLCFQWDEGAVGVEITDYH